MIIREKYLSKIRPFYDQDLIKVIMGVRRCGKSVIYRIYNIFVPVIIDYQNLLLKYSNSLFKIIKLTVYFKMVRLFWVIGLFREFEG